MTHLQHRISTSLLAGALAVATIAAIPAAAAVAADTPDPGACTTTISGPLTGALTAAVGKTCLTNVTLPSGIPVEDAATEIEGNSIGGTLTCSGNNPVPTNDMKPNTVSSTRTGETCASSTF